MIDQINKKEIKWNKIYMNKYTNIYIYKVNIQYKYINKWIDWYINKYEFKSNHY